MSFDERLLSAAAGSSALARRSNIDRDGMPNAVARDGELDPLADRRQPDLIAQLCGTAEAHHRRR